MTSIDTVVEGFLRKVEEDEDFFEYYNCTEEEALEIAKERATGYVDEAVSYLQFSLKGHSAVDFSDRNSTQFNFDLVSIEIDIIVRIMYWIYFERGLSKLKPVINSFSSSDIKSLFSPANERKTYTEMVAERKREVDVLISNYRAINRITGKPKVIEYEDI